MQYCRKRISLMIDIEKSFKGQWTKDVPFLTGYILSAAVFKELNMGGGQIIYGNLDFAGFTDVFDCRTNTATGAAIETGNVGIPLDKGIGCSLGLIDHSFIIKNIKNFDIGCNYSHVYFEHIHGG